MVKLPESNDPTLVAVDAAMEEGQKTYDSNGIGMGSLGHDCDRSGWYDFRWTAHKRFDAASLKRFDDGNIGEDLQAKRLRMVQGITLLTVDPETGRQFRLEHMGGHLSGYMDGEILGLLQAPKTWHVFEHKQVDQSSRNRLAKLKRTLGEKTALSEWNFKYYVQAQLYMRYRGLDRHYMTVSTPGGRDTISVRTNYDGFFAAQQEKRAERIVFAPTPPDRIKDDPDAFPCNMCSHRDMCHGVAGALPARRNCRTCIHATPREDGSWFCEKHEDILDYKAQQAACCDHRFIPQLVHGEQIDAAEDGSWVSYVLPDGTTWIDGSGS